jgi:tripartite-type tricarboxylate transporter receptor subunit TctC
MQLSARNIRAAQSYLERPVRMVLSFGAPGGTPDAVARVIGPKLTETWGKQVVIDPRSGAGGVLGTDIVITHCCCWAFRRGCVCRS